MFAAIRRLIVLAIPIAVLSCSIRDDSDDCGTWLEFIFDHNMEFTDLFDPQVPTVDVYIFDEKGKYLLRRYADCGNELAGHKRMYIGNDLPEGDYEVLTVGGLSDHFRFTDLDGYSLAQGITTIEQVKVSLDRLTGEVSHEFPHLWFGEVINIRHRNKGTVWPVYLIRNTNNFRIVLHDMDAKEAGQTSATVPYTMEIVTPEGAVYGYDNNPLIREKVTYLPFHLAAGMQPGDLSVGNLNTVRLFADDPDGYRLVVRDAGTLQQVWNYDFMSLLRNTKPILLNGTMLSLQEYLDRRGEWDIKVLYREGEGPDSGFIALAVEVNGWILWLKDIEVRRQEG